MEKILNPDYGKIPIFCQGPNKNISSEEFDRQSQEMWNRLIPLITGEDITPHNKILPINTKSLNKEGVEVVLDFLKANGRIVLLYGSYTIYFQTIPKFRRVPRDINIMLNTDRAGAAVFTDTLFNKLKEAGQKVRISPYWQFHIQSFKQGNWVLAIDVHFNGIPKNELEWQYYPKDDLSRGKTEIEAKFIDVLDTYTLLLTFLEWFKKDPSKKLKVKQSLELISLFKEHFANLLDFKNLKIKGYPDLP